MACNHYGRSGTTTGVLLLDRQLQEDEAEWNSNKSAGVNDPPSDYFEAQGANDGSRILGVINTYAGDRNYAGALVSNKRTLPRYNGNLLPHVAFHTRFRWPRWSYRNLARHELDLKVCLKTRPSANITIRNVANFSTQWNRETGMFQIDKDPPQWIDTGFVVEEIAPDEWHDIDYRFWFDEAAGVFSVLSIELDRLRYDIPEELQRVLLQETNWEEIASVQKQNEMLKPGATAIEYVDTGLAWSDEPIGCIDWTGGRP